MIVTVTLNPAVDHTLQVNEEPVPNAVTRTDDAQFDPGGKGINVSKYLVDLGVDTVATGVVGDFLGQYLTDSLTQTGISNDFVEITGCTRLNTTILTPDNEYKINRSGPAVDEGAVQRVVGKIRKYSPDTVVIAGSLPLEVDSKAIDVIATAGTWRTVVDLEGSILRELNADYALCKPNREELAAATGQSVETLDDCVTAARALQRQGFKCVVASLGDDGAVMATSNSILHTPAVDVDVVDTVGAGDALLAGVLAQRRLNGTDEAALRAGVAVASRVVSVSGTQMPPLDDVLPDIDDIAVSTH